MIKKSFRCFERHLWFVFERFRAYMRLDFSSKGFSILKLLGVVFVVILCLAVFSVLLLEDEDEESYGTMAGDSWDEDGWYADDAEYVEDDDYWAQERAKKKGKKGKKGRGKLDPRSGFESEDALRDYVKVVVDSTTEVWTKLFQEHNKHYVPPKLKIFEDEVSTACGDADYSDGPFYCYLDQTVYLDLNFFINMTDEVGAGGDFAYAYVIAHEVGHHVQYLTGDLEKYTRIQEKLEDSGKTSKANLVSVQSELQADFYAGVWAHHEDKKYNSISEKDIEQAFEAAVAVGDDILGEDSRENFSHGSAEMRLVWLYNGMLSGDMSRGNTYQYKSLNQLEKAEFEDDEAEEDERSFREKKMGQR